jgi:peroxiredoxin
MTDWVVERLARSLKAEERDAVLGDLEEGGVTGWKAASQVCGLILRRQVLEWRHWQPWAALLGIVGAAGLSIGGLTPSLTRDASLQSRTWWNYGVRYRTGLTWEEDVAIFVCFAVAVTLWAWMAGFALRRFSGKATWFTGGLLSVELLILGGLGLLIPAWFGMRRARTLGWPRLVSVACLAAAGCVWGAKLLQSQAISRWIGSGLQPRGPGLWDLLGLAMACWPAVYVLAMSTRRLRMKTAGMVVGVLLLAGSLPAADGVKATMIEENARKAAPDFAIADQSGKLVKLSALRGKVVLVNFWATYCGGCKVETPWFQEFENQWEKKGLAVVGLSLDEGGWKDVTPYVEKTGVKYRMVIADKAVLDKYTFDAMPATYLVDKKGRIAARYIGLVERADIEGKIKTLLAP